MNYGNRVYLLIEAVEFNHNPKVFAIYNLARNNDFSGIMYVYTYPKT